jgi:hypothetical protein
MSAKKAPEKKRKSAFEVYCDLVAVFAKLRRMRAKARKKAGKYNPKTGLIRLARASKFKKAKKNKIRRKR